MSRSSVLTYPVAEHFYSIQGEGVFTGTPMFFLRLAGCNVGKYTSGDERSYLSILRRQHPEHSICETVTGQKFLCDTDYHKTQILSVDEIEKLVDKHKHICITGGEPFMHNLVPLFDAMSEQVQVHVETSGTLPILRGLNEVWVTCSPKVGFLDDNRHRVDEWKFVVAAESDLEKIVAFLGDDDDIPTFLQPCNHIDKPDVDMTKLVLDLVRTHPQFRLSAQLHKYLNLR